MRDSNINLKKTGSLNGLGGVSSKGSFELFKSGCQPLSDLSLDLVSYGSENRGIYSTWCSQVDTMSTVVTVDKEGGHVALGGWVKDLSHTCILPRVFNGVSIDNVATGDVETSVEIVVVISVWGTDIVCEDILAELEPVVWA